MATREEFISALEQAEEALSRLGLMVMAFRRMESELWPEKPTEEPILSPPWTTK